MGVDILKQASDPAASADLAVASMQEGLAIAYICLIGRSTALNKFFENVLQSFLKNVHFNVVRCAVIASSGFTKDQFHKYLRLEAERRQLWSIIENKYLKEFLDAPNVMNMIKDTKAAQEVRALKEFFNMLSNDPDRACYGPKHVEVAHERMAVQTLLITDDLFRNSNTATRQQYVESVNSVEGSGGNAFIFSSMHVSRAVNETYQNGY
ncbi:hypothetical protein MKX01_008531 [Papaver californicum]|nr:hypothetical protein MKX01_008531 [Papaver californicum]